MACRATASALALLSLVGHSAGDCSCTYQGSVLNESIYTNYPSSDPGKYKDKSSIGKYGTMCAAWDQAPGTPWSSYCPPDSDWSDPSMSWCQIPWCYVDASCDSRVASSVFAGSAVFYSYAACGNSPDCYNDGPDGPAGAGTPGCPYDPDAEGDHLLSKSSCACKYQGETLPEALYKNYPSSDPGKYASEVDIELYGVTCAAWDQSPSTPWFSYCPAEADWCSTAYNWCQLPWCYVDESCPTRIASSVFGASSGAYYSYDTCLSTPDCYMNSAPDNHPSLPDACPYDKSDAGWATAKECPSGWTDRIDAVTTTNGDALEDFASNASDTNASQEDAATTTTTTGDALEDFASNASASAMGWAAIVLAVTGYSFTG